MKAVDLEVSPGSDDVWYVWQWCTWLSLSSNIPKLSCFRNELAGACDRSRVLHSARDSALVEYFAFRCSSSSKLPAWIGWPLLALFSFKLLSVSLLHSRQLKISNTYLPKPSQEPINGEWGVLRRDQVSQLIPPDLAPIQVPHHGPRVQHNRYLVPAFLQTH
jgi:hypothetical protein